MSRKNYPVFYIPIGEDRLDHKYCKILQKETSSILAVSQREQQDPKKLALYDQSKWRVLENYPEIKDILEDKFSDFAADLGIGNYVKDGSKHEDWTPTRARYQITTSWITDLKEGDYVQIHSHKNNEWSGIVYFDDDYTDQPSLTFKNPLRIFSSYSPERPAIGLSTDWERYPEPQLILFWQSYLEHGVDFVVRSDKPRRSLAFNIMPVGPYGEADSSMDTRWLNF
jgi:hypothetical protein